ncbi:hypothetical protein KRR26_22315 [Corallococcus sp. M34]|uniref:hypothetical protein n=1 Tax=Citreicoccus inhibens TaxID=2849499 RepID=UPI001C228A9D|nr:hypothetical protein [Citreicoccus inhibens]MBU8898350.1 hypothetical protein [Citreicoccus inhibens]
MASLRRATTEARVQQRVEALLAEPPSVETTATPAWTHETLAPVVRRGVERGILELGDVRRYVGLASALGADFETQRPHAWMRAWLDDTAVSDPVARLHRVLTERRRREDVARMNRQRAEAFRLRHAPPPTST